MKDLKQILKMFTSQTVVYGIDYNIPQTHHVVGLYYGEERIDMSADSCMQQIARIREPITIMLWINDKNLPQKFESEEEVIEEYQSVVGKVGHVQKELRDYAHRYDNFKIGNIHHKHRYSDLQYHIPDLLDKKGFVNFSHHGDPTKKTKVIKDKNYQDEEIHERVSLYWDRLFELERLEQDDYLMTQYSIKKTDNEEVQKYVLGGSSYIDTLRRYLMQRGGQYTRMFLSNDKDTRFGQLESEDGCLYVMNKLHKLLKLEWWNINAETHILPFGEDLSVEVGPLMDEFKYSFPHHRLPAPTYNSLVIFLMNLYKSFFRNLLVEANRKENI